MKFDENPFMIAHKPVEDGFPFEVETDSLADSMGLRMPNRSLYVCLLYTSPSPRDRTRSRMPSSA